MTARISDVPWAADGARHYRDAASLPAQGGTGEPFVEVGFHQMGKHGQSAVGDALRSCRPQGEDRTILVLADGLGSGIKARVLATLTASMASRYVSADMDVRRASEVVLSTLPLCSKRRIGYSTFTIVDIRPGGTVRVTEHDNPAFALVRQGERVELPAETLHVQRPGLGPGELRYCEFRAQPGDRIVVFSDGLSQAGMGGEHMPLGWTREGVADYAVARLRANASLSARDLARELVHEAVRRDGAALRDDATCAAIYLRRPRRLLVVSGPPISRARDADMAAALDRFDGRRAICGGTTAALVARELNRRVSMNMGELDAEVPPSSSMEGADLITEGTITLSRVARMLERGTDPETQPANAATRLLRLLLESDVIHFLVGTKINDAHQDPNLPEELDIRRNLIKRLAALLSGQHLKQAHVRYL